MSESRPPPHCTHLLLGVGQAGLRGNGVLRAMAVMGPMPAAFQVLSPLCSYLRRQVSWGQGQNGVRGDSRKGCHVVGLLCPLPLEAQVNSAPQDSQSPGPHGHLGQPHQSLQAQTCEQPAGEHGLVPLCPQVCVCVSSGVSVCVWGVSVCVLNCVCVCVEGVRVYPQVCPCVFECVCVCVCVECVCVCGGVCLCVSSTVCMYRGCPCM